MGGAVTPERKAKMTLMEMLSDEATLDMQTSSSVYLRIDYLLCRFYVIALIFVTTALDGICRLPADSDNLISFIFTSREVINNDNDVQVS